ncbi:MAG: TolC family protein [Pseudoxanthomonas sp.]
MDADPMTAAPVSMACRRIHRRWALLAAAVFWLPSWAQSGGQAMDFDAAHARLQAVSDALRASDLAIEDKRQLATAAQRLRLPNISADIKLVDSEKTLEIPLGPLEPLASQYGIDSPLVLESHSWRTRPILQATLPLYTGGAIPAQQQLSAAAVQQAQAEHELQADTLLTQLVQAYFGQSLAERVVVARREARDGLQQHLVDTARLEKHGFATHAQQLQAQVARDQAEREFQKAGNDLETARQTLALLLRSPPIEAVTLLFVLPEPIGTREQFRERVGTGHPQLDRFQAIVEQSRQGVRLQQARQKPEVFAFGQYDVHKEDATFVEPDWAVGVGIRYSFLSGGRRQQVAAARARNEQAEAGLQEVRVQLDIAVTRAFDAMANARVQFVLLESAIAQAEENLRLQTLSFREGQATSLDVIDARVALVNARVARAQAAYQFDVSLAQLLEASGQAGQFPRYVELPTKVNVQ